MKNSDQFQVCPLGNVFIIRPKNPSSRPKRRRFMKVVVSNMFAVHPYWGKLCLLSVKCTRIWGKFQPLAVDSAGEPQKQVERLVFEIGWWQLKYVLFFTPKLLEGKMNPFWLKRRFFKGVESWNHQLDMDTFILEKILCLQQVSYHFHCLMLRHTVSSIVIVLPVFIGCWNKYIISRNFIGRKRMAVENEAQKNRFWGVKTIQENWHVPFCFARPEKETCSDSLDCFRRGRCIEDGMGENESSEWI